MSLLKLPTVLSLSSVLGLGLVAACGSGPVNPAIDVSIDDASQRLVVVLNRSLKSGERVHTRVRMGSIGQLDCTAELASIPRIDSEVYGAVAHGFLGPELDEALFEEVYDDSWLEGEPTAEMLAKIADGQAIIDVCWMSEGGVVREAEFDVRRALDRKGVGGKADGEEERIASTEAYAERCVEELGDIPFFEPLAEGDYGTFNCLDATPIATTVTDADGNVTHPEEQADACDNPQYIYSLCEPNAVAGQTNGPRVTSAANEDGTHWVLLCRKAKEDEGAYNDIAMIGHNPYTGKTCYFQNALYSRTDGLHVPHPGDKVESETSPQQSTSLWSGIHGGIGSGISCARCHDADPFIHTPWIDQAVGAEGDPVVPKMGIDENFTLGFNDSPYSIVNLQGQGWTMPKHIVSEEAAACTRCHRIGDGRWADDWMDRMIGEDSTWKNKVTESHQTFAKTFWMPPDVDGLDETTWADSDFGRAVTFIQNCANNPDDEGCEWAELPTEAISDPGELPEIELEGEELARAAAIALGADVLDSSCPDGNCSSRRCAECHSVSRGGLSRWLDYTRDGWEQCGLNRDADDMTQTEALAAVNCMRINPADDSSVFVAAKIGVLTTGVQYGAFRKLFQKAYGDTWLPSYLQFKARIGMPKGSHPKMSQKEYATIEKWFREGLPSLDVVEDPPAPLTCEAHIDTMALTAHVDEMRFDGWGAVNKENGIHMFGCQPGTSDARTCFQGSSFPSRTNLWGNHIGVLRQLDELDFWSSYWTRSSADGRYVGNGGGTWGATITDLATGTDIPVDASYDPGFFPDNSGFIFQGSIGGAGICPQSVLATNESIDFSEPECMTASGINLYQHVARGVGGGDYFVINSQFTSDAGGNSSDPEAYFGATSTMKFTPMVFNGTTYDQEPEVIVDSPYEGDSVLSPSAQLVVSRLAGQTGESLGYVVRRVRATPFGGTYQIDIDHRVATICMPGAKANISFDERWLVTHHYEGDRANIYMADLVTGEQYKITDMPAGAEARFPHFRSDGWFYFLVVDGSGEYIVASDAAIVLGGN